jgi:hypothetical protein
MPAFVDSQLICTQYVAMYKFHASGMHAGLYVCK